MKKVENKQYKEGYDQAFIDLSYNIKRGLKDEKIRESFTKELNDLIDEIKEICYENERPSIEEAFEKDEVYFESSIVDEDLTMYFDLPSKYLPKKFENARDMTVSIAIPMDEMLLAKNADCMYGAVDFEGHTIDWLDWDLPYEIIDKFIDIYLSNNMENAIANESVTFDRMEDEDNLTNLYFTVPSNYLPKEVFDENDDDTRALFSTVKLVANKALVLFTEHVIKVEYATINSNDWKEIDLDDYVIGQLIILYKESIRKDE